MQAPPAAAALHLQFELDSLPSRYLKNVAPEKQRFFNTVVQSHVCKTEHAEYNKGFKSVVDIQRLGGFILLTLLHKQSTKKS